MHTSFPVVFLLFPSRNQDEVKACYSCKLPGHLARDCPYSSKNDKSLPKGAKTLARDAARAVVY